jgi:plasmid stabilization system protein ParE
VGRRRYVLTLRAAADLREITVWSRARWGAALTAQYLKDLNKGAQYVADNHASLRGQHELAGGTSLLLYLVREHFLIYEPLDKQSVAVVAFIRQRRDVPAILQKWAAPIRRELVEIRRGISRGETARRSAVRKSRVKD